MIRRGIVIPEYEEVMSAPEETTEDTPVDIMGMGMDGDDTTGTADSTETTGAPAQGENSEQDNGSSLESGDTAAPVPVEETAPAQSEGSPSENQNDE
jgi:hypothetical protein